MKAFLFNLVVVCALIFGIPFNGFAQKKDPFKGELYLGVGGGTLFSKVDFVPGVPLAFKQGYFGGLAGKYISEKNLGLIAEVNFTQRGWTETYDPSTNFSYSRTLNYVEIPFMTHIYFGQRTRFIVNLGPQISLLMGDKEEMSQALSDDVDARRAANPDAQIGMQYEGIYPLKKVDYGLVGGVGMELKTGMGDFDIEGRYYFGLGDIFTSRRSEKAYFSRSASRLIEAKLTYYIKFF